MEVPTAADILPLVAGPDVRVTWLPRWTSDVAVPALRGTPLTAAVIATARELAGAVAPPAVQLDDVDVDAGILWEVPPDDALPRSGLYAWLAGEAGMVKGLRRHLMQEVGLDRSAVAFMGYWRQGRGSD